MILNKKIGFVLISVFILAISCRLQVSFTGESIESDVNTINVKYFDNRAPIVEPTLSDYLTDQLQLKYESETRLSLVNSNNADLILEGQIIKYDQSYTGLNADEKAELNRLTIGVKFIFTNNKHPEKNFETTISEFEEYSSDKNLDEVSDELIEIIVDKIIEKIFLKTVADW